MPGRFWAFLIAAATALVILGASIVPFLTDDYIHLEQERAGAERLTGYNVYELQAVTTSLVHDLLLGGDFARIDSSGEPALSEREQAHMRDVRGVFQGFFALVAVGIVVIAVGFARARGPEARAAFWRAVSGGARGLVVVLVVTGAFAMLAFDAAFEVFHRLFFSAGSYTFDPRSDRLVQLFPEQFWSETAIAVGAVAIVVAVLAAWGAGRRAGASRPAAVLSASKAGT